MVCHDVYADILDIGPYSLVEEEEQLVVLCEAEIIEREVERSQDEGEGCGLYEGYDGEELLCQQHSDHYGRQDDEHGGEGRCDEHGYLSLLGYEPHGLHARLYLLGEMWVIVCGEGDEDHRCALCRDACRGLVQSDICRRPVVGYVCVGYVDGELPHHSRHHHRHAEVCHAAGCCPCLSP